jgi:hypothetical protein
MWVAARDRWRCRWWWAGGREPEGCRLSTLPAEPGWWQPGPPRPHAIEARFTIWQVLRRKGRTTPRPAGWLLPGLLARLRNRACQPGRRCRGWGGRQARGLWRYRACGWRAHVRWCGARRCGRRGGHRYRTGRRRRARSRWAGWRCAKWPGTAWRWPECRRPASWRAAGCGCGRPGGGGASAAGRVGPEPPPARRGDLVTAGLVLREQLGEDVPPHAPAGHPRLGPGGPRGQPHRTSRYGCGRYHRHYL